MYNIIFSKSISENIVVDKCIRSISLDSTEDYQDKNMIDRKLNSKLTLETLKKKMLDCLCPEPYLR